jgi:hypothetical protein
MVKPSGSYQGGIEIMNIPRPVWYILGAAVVVVGILILIVSLPSKPPDPEAGNSVQPSPSVPILLQPADLTPTPRLHFMPTPTLTPIPYVT